MIRPWIKILIAGIIGFGAGFGSGFFAHKKLNDVQFQEISEEEMKEIEETVAKRQGRDPQEEIHRVFNPVTDIPKEKLPEDPDQLRNALQGKTPYIQADKDQKTAYEKLWKATKDYSNEENANELPTMPEEEEFDEAFLKEVLEEEPDDKMSFVEPPHVIGLAEFYNERPEFDKVTIDWFEPDNVWLDEKEEIIADISSYVGMTDVVKLFSENSPDDDPDVRFIRNEQYGSDYEIIRHHRSWRETTGGV